MDSLLPLLLFFVFIALRFLGKRKPRRAQNAEQLPSAHDESEGVEMEEALRQIREALGMPAPTPRPAPPAPPPSALPPPVPVQRPAPPPRPTPRPELRPVSAPLREKRFTNKASVVAPATRHGLGGRPAPPVSPPANDPVVDMLKSPADAERAFLLSEIFGPPRAQRKRRR